MRATVERGRKTGRRSSTPTPGRTDVIVPVMDQGVARIRLARERVEKGNFAGSLMVEETSHYLDGSTLRAIITRDRTIYERSTMGTAAIPLRSRDVTDFGRLEQAVQTLVRQMQQFGPDNPPTAEQQEALIAAYHGILAWKEKANAQMARADGQIDTAAILLRQVMGA